MNKKNIYILSIIVVSIFMLDFITKYIVHNNLVLHEEHTVIGGLFYITYARNTGAAWSVLEGKMTFFYLISIASLGFFIYLAKDNDFKEKKIYSISIALLIAGTLGNFYDRVVFKFVIDFLDFHILGYNFPIFNIADISLVSGVIGILIYYLFLEEEAEYGKNKFHSRNK